MSSSCIELTLFTNQTLASSCLCPINQGVVHRPLLHSCGTFYCEGCLSSHLKSSSKCVGCKETFDRSQLISPMNLNNTLKGLELKCRHFKRGCRWKGKYSNFHKHLLECDKKHRIQPKQKMTCIACLQKFEIEKMDKHKQECGFRKVQCTQGCSQKVEAINMAFHISVDCMLTVQKCPFEPFGCQFSGRADQMAEHTQDARAKIYHQRIENEAKVKNQCKIIGLLEGIQSLLKQRAEDSKMCDNLKEISETINPTKKQKASSKKTKNNLLLPQLNLTNAPPKKKTVFSSFKKGDNIKISNRGTTVRGTSKAYQVAQLSLPVLPYQHFTFTVDLLGSPVAIGLGDSMKLMKNNFNLRYGNVNHGCFLLCSDGSHLVDNRGGFFWPDTTMRFRQGDVVDMVYEFDRARIVFVKVGSGEGTAVYLPSVIDVENLRPTVYVFDEHSQVTFLNL